MALQNQRRPRIGWPLLPVPDERGQLNYPSLEESVRQLIRVLLSTRPGEQLMRPDFGAGLQNYMHQPNDLTTRRRIHDAIRETLDQYETRIILDRIDVQPDSERLSHLRILLGYRLRRNGQVRQMSFALEWES